MHGRLGPHSRGPCYLKPDDSALIVAPAVMISAAAASAAVDPCPAAAAPAPPPPPLFFFLPPIADLRCLRHLFPCAAATNKRRLASLRTAPYGLLAAFARGAAGDAPRARCGCANVRVGVDGGACWGGGDARAWTPAARAHGTKVCACASEHVCGAGRGVLPVSFARAATDRPVSVSGGRCPGRAGCRGVHRRGIRLPGAAAVVVAYDPRPGR